MHTYTRKRKQKLLPTHFPEIICLQRENERERERVPGKIYIHLYVHTYLQMLLCMYLHICIQIYNMIFSIYVCTIKRIFLLINSNRIRYVS